MLGLKKKNIRCGQLGFRIYSFLLVNRIKLNMVSGGDTGVAFIIVYKKKLGD